MKKSMFYIWFAPLWALLGFHVVRLVIAEWSCYPVFGIISLGIGLAFIVLFLALSFWIKYRTGQVVISILTLILCQVPTILYINARGGAFLLLFLISIYLQGWAIYAILDVFHLAKWRRNIAYFKEKRNYVTLNFKISICTILACAITSPLLVSQYFSSVETSPTTYTISNDAASSYDLVVYFPDESAIDQQIANIFLEVDATISIPMNWAEFDINSASGNLTAEKVELLNNNSVKVEIWPLFGNEYGHYPSWDNVEYWDELYERFHGWVTRNNLTVDYLMWDIETNNAAPEWSLPRDAFTTLPGFLQEIAYFGAQAGVQSQVSRQWANLLANLRSVNQQARNDGYGIRATTFTIVADNFDGDGDKQVRYGLPAWDASDAFDYISMMIYRGCEWGGTPSESSWIYEMIRAESLTWTGIVAACLGCINYTPYPNITSVVDDVRLALAAGLFAGNGREPGKISVRLFQANSWIDGVGTWYNTKTGNWIYGGPAHGVDNETTGGLRQLLLECRQGGDITFYPSASARSGLFLDILLDVLYDLGKPFV